jgi:hypothetical protein
MSRTVSHHRMDWDHVYKSANCRLDRLNVDAWPSPLRPVINFDALPTIQINLDVWPTKFRRLTVYLASSHQHGRFTHCILERLTDQEMSRTVSHHRMDRDHMYKSANWTLDRLNLEAWRSTMCPVINLGVSHSVYLDASPTRVCPEQSVTTVWTEIICISRLIGRFTD